MKPINSAERKSAYLNFLILFAITIVIVVTTCFFGMRVPFKQNEQLQEKIAGFQNQKSFAENFETRFANTKGILDTVNKAGIQAELLDQKITDGIKSLSAMVDNDTTIVKKNYNDVIQNLAELQFAKKQLRDVSSSNQNMTQYMQQIEGLKSDLARAKSESDALRMQLVSLSQGK